MEQMCWSFTNSINLLQQEVKSDKKRTENIQFVEERKKSKKGVDKSKRRWYYNKAVARSGFRKKSGNRLEQRT